MSYGNEKLGETDLKEFQKKRKIHLPDIITMQEVHILLNMSGYEGEKFTLLWDYNSVDPFRHCLLTIVK